MSKHVAFSPNEAADCLAIRELIEAYAHCADRRDVRSNVPLYRGQPLPRVHERQGSDTLTRVHSREALAAVFAELNKYDATTHFVGQSTILTLMGDRGTGETYCLTHHVTVGDRNRRLMIASLRHLDRFVKIDGAWLFWERRLYADWLEDRPLS